MRPVFFILSFLLLACPRMIRGDAVIEGRVLLPVINHPHLLKERYNVSLVGGAIVPDPRVAVVFLEGTFPNAGAAPVRRMIQRELLFEPAILPVQVGTKVEFPNLDSVAHNLFSYSPAKRFELGTCKPHDSLIHSQVFDTTGLITVRCDLHESMRGLILVLDTPFFVTTTNTGEYRLSGLPTGHYKLKAWVSSKSTLEHDVQLNDGATVHVDFR